MVTSLRSSVVRRPSTTKIGSRSLVITPSTRGALDSPWVTVASMPAWGGRGWSGERGVRGRGPCQAHVSVASSSPVPSPPLITSTCRALLLSVCGRPLAPRVRTGHRRRPGLLPPPSGQLTRLRVELVRPPPGRRQQRGAAEDGSDETEQTTDADEDRASDHESGVELRPRLGRFDACQVAAFTVSHDRIIGGALARGRGGGTCGDPPRGGAEPAPWQVIACRIG